MKPLLQVALTTAFLAGTVLRSDAAAPPAVPAALDGVGISTCVGAANSLHPYGSVLVADGSTSISTASLTFTITHMPAGEFGRLVGGVIGTPKPFGDGTLCIDTEPGILRLPAFRADTTGRHDRPLDFAALPPGLLAPGTTLAFQALYRDRSSKGARLNLSSSLAIMLTP